MKKRAFVAIRMLRVLAAALPPAILIPCLLFTVRGYTLRPDALLVRRLLWSTQIPLTGLQSAHEEPHAMRGALRVFGNGGVYSFTGLYWKKGFGSFRAFVTDLNRCVVLRLPQRTIVVSPGEPDRFVKQVSGR